MTTTRLDPNKAEAFAERLLDILNSGAIALAMSLGHRTKLLDAMENLPLTLHGFLYALHDRIAG